MDVDGDHIRIVEDCDRCRRAPPSPRRQLLLGVSAALAAVLWVRADAGDRALDIPFPRWTSAEAYLGIGSSRACRRDPHLQVSGCEPWSHAISRLPPRRRAFSLAADPLSMLDGVEDNGAASSSPAPCRPRARVSARSSIAQRRFALQAAIRTLLIDGDLRGRPSLHQMFGGTGPGLTELPCGTRRNFRAPCGTPLSGTGVENLFCWGTCLTSRVRGLLGRGSMREVIRLRWRRSDQRP